MGNFLPNRAVRVVERLAQQADVLVGALDAVERCRGLGHGSGLTVGNHRAPEKNGQFGGKKGRAPREQLFQVNRIRGRISFLVRTVLSSHAGTKTVTRLSTTARRAMTISASGHLPKAPTS